MPTLINAGDYDSQLRQEIIESEKTQANFLKWKLISIAAIGSVYLSFKVANKYDLKILLGIIPLICAYVDCISYHLMLRIIVIGTYLQKKYTKINKAESLPCIDYESFVQAVAKRPSRFSASPFGLELTAIHASSLAISLFVLLYGLIIALMGANAFIAYAFFCSGTIGLLVIVTLFMTFGRRVEKITETPIESVVDLK